MKIAIDLQATQSRQSRNRGIGRYTQALIENLLRLHPEHDYFLYANASLPPPILDAPQSDTIHLLPFSPDGLDAANETLLEATLLAERPDIVFLPSPMEDADAVVPDFGGFPAWIYVVCYDLIPLLFADRYLQDGATRSQYMRRLKNIQKADYVLTDSESTRQDAIRELGLDAERVTNIRGGPSAVFAPLADGEGEEWRQRLSVKLGVHRPFLLCTAGGDWRKNVRGLIAGFGLLPAALKERYQLVIACHLTEEEKERLREFARTHPVNADALILTGFISDEELRALYSLCALFVFPSYYEGFGLPLVEAMACGAPVISAGNSSLREIVRDPEHQFDARDPASIADCIQQTLSDAETLACLTAKGAGIAAEFNWNHVAQTAWTALNRTESRPAESVRLRRGQPAPDGRKRLAFFSPFRPLRSGISDYSEELLMPLSSHFDIELYVEDGYVPALENGAMFRSRSGRAYEVGASLPNRQYDALIYQMGNSSFHEYIFDILRRHAGITVLHDYNLTGLLARAEAIHSPLGLALSEELAYSYGPKRAAEIQKNLETGAWNLMDLPNHDIYANRQIFTRSLGVILHSKWGYDKARQEFGAECEFIAHIPHLISPRPLPAPEEIAQGRRQESIPEGGVVFIACGGISLSKRPLQLLDAFRAHIARRPQDYLIFVGADEMLNGMGRETTKRGLTSHVRVTGFVHGLDEFYRWIDLADVGVTLRYPSSGETSGALLRLLSQGKPCIATDIGSFADYPAEIVCKIPSPDKGDEIGALTAALHLLATNDALRERMGREARAIIERENSPEACARHYAEFIHEVMRSGQTRAKLLADYIGRGMARTGEASEEEKARRWQAFRPALRQAWEGGGLMGAL